MMKKLLFLAFLTFTLVGRSQFQVMQSFNGGGQCVDVQDGSMSFTVTGVSPPFNCIVTNTSGCVITTPSLTTSQSAFTFTGIPGCTSLYQLNVYTTANVFLGSQYFSFGVYSATPLSVNTFSMMAANCPTCCNGSVYLSTNGGSFPPQFPVASYSIDNVYLGSGFFPASGLCPGAHTVCAKDYVGCTKCTTLTIPFSLPTGVIENNALSSFKIFPNPFSNEINFLNEDPSVRGKKIIITNVVGKEIYEGNVSEDDIKIQLDFLEPGIYFVYYHSTQNKIFKSKIVKL